MSARKVAWVAHRLLNAASGASTTIFSLVYALVLREANVRDPQSLVQVSSLVPPRNFENWLT